MKTIKGTTIEKDSRGKKYRVWPSGTAYDVRTPIPVMEVLESLIGTRRRIKVYYGEHKTGRDWHEEYDVTGRLGRSTGTIKIPLLIHSERSCGGPALLDHCIVKIREGARVLYQTKKYKAPKIEIREESNHPGYTHAVMVDGDLYGNCKSEKSAKLLKARLQ